MPWSSAPWEWMVIVRVFDGTSGSAVAEELDAIAELPRMREQIHALRAAGWISPGARHRSTAKPPFRIVSVR
ncbi:hypothetical protein BRAS3809_3140002 [Bradyrhizobium sp. STM 3809]|nr:hypothetical protein BRAS3809_3140002 [Bradyrhizobium sp. STM 3809]